MKEFDQIFKDMDRVFKDTERVFKQVDSDMNKIFKDMDKIFKDAQEINTVARKREVGPWKPWFAWRPVTVKNKRVWFKKIYRRKINTYVDYDNWARYEYGDMFDVLKGAGE